MSYSASGTDKFQTEETTDSITHGEVMIATQYMISTLPYTFALSEQD